MLDLFTFLLESDLATLQDSLGEMYEPTLSAVVVLSLVLPAFGLTECFCSLSRLFCGGDRK